MGCIWQRTACRALSAAALLAAVCLVLAGCGGSADKASVEGKVVYKGKPVTGGVLTFNYENGMQYPLKINGDDGTFRGSGLPTGKATVTVDTRSLKTGAAGPVIPGFAKMPKDMAASLKAQEQSMRENRPQAQQPAGKYVEIPRQYENRKTSPITWELNPGNNHKDIELQ